MKLLSVTAASLLASLVVGHKSHKASRTSTVQTTLLSVPSRSDDCAVDQQSLRAQAIQVASTKIRNEPRTHTLTYPDGETEVFPLNHGPVLKKAPEQELYLGEVARQAVGIKQLDNVKAEAIRNVTRDKLAELMETKDELTYADYARMYDLLDKEGLIPKPVSLNNSDEVFGAVRLGFRGHNLKLVHHHDKSYRSDLHKAVTNSLVKRVCGESSLDAALAHHRVFVSDFTNTTQYNDDETTLDKFGVETRGYFCYNADRELFLPLAIAILDTGLVYTRDDSPGEWQFAKMALDTMELNFQQMRHLAEVHMMMIPIEVELMRTVSTTHPIYQLLRYHFSPNFALEISATTILWVIDAPYDKSLSYGARGSLRYVLDELRNVNVGETAPEEFTRRGLHHVPINRLTKYGLKYFDILGEFVHSFVDAYYHRDSDVTADCELQNWAKNVQTIPEIHGFPTEFTSRDDLESLVTQLIFQNAVKHHFMNGIISWHSSAAPFTTPSLWNKAKGLPKKKGVEVNPLDYAMPPEIVSELSYLGAQFFRPLPREVTLLDVYKNTTFEAQPQLLPAIQKLRADMESMETYVLDEEEKMAVPLDFFRPSKLPYFAFI